MNILIVELDNDLGVTDGVFAFFVRPRVQGCHVDVFDLFVFVGGVIQLDRVGATPEESIPVLEWFDDV